MIRLAYLDNNVIFNSEVISSFYLRRRRRKMFIFDALRELCIDDRIRGGEHHVLVFEELDMKAVDARELKELQCILKVERH